MSISEIDNQVVNILTCAAEELGFNSTDAKIYAILFISDEEMSQDELSEISGYSLSIVSRVLKHLVSNSDIVKIKPEGQRKKTYKCTHEKEGSECNMIYARLLDILKSGINSLDLCVKEYNSVYPKNNSTKNKIEWINTLTGRHKKIVKIIEFLSSCEDMKLMDTFIEAIEKGEKK